MHPLLVRFTFRHISSSIKIALSSIKKRVSTSTSVGNRASALFVPSLPPFLFPINYLLKYNHRSIVDCLIVARVISGCKFPLFFSRYAFYIAIRSNGVSLLLSLAPLSITPLFFHPLERDQPFVMSFRVAARPKATFTINKLAIRWSTEKLFAVFNRNCTRRVAWDKKSRLCSKSDDVPGQRFDSLLFLLIFITLLSFGTMSWRWTILAANSSISEIHSPFLFHAFKERISRYQKNLAVRIIKLIRLITTRILRIFTCW